MKANIINKEYSEILKERMLDYYDEILCHRSIPETRDGLMEVQRRIIWTMHEKKFGSANRFSKCAKINGMATSLHPHGTSSIYDALVNMSQFWKNNIVLMEPSGSNGSIYGDEQAADRYLEMRMDKNCEAIYLDDIKSNCIDMIDNYDLTEMEPLILPSKLPMYLCNGCFGIAGGYAISVPTHNPGEVIDQTIAKIKDSNHEVNLLPDFPTGGTIATTNELYNGYKKGRGQVIIRGTILRDEKKHQLIITEIPYMKTLIKINSELQDLSKDRKDPKSKKTIEAIIPGIKNLKDNSDSNKIRLIVEVKRDYPLELVEGQIFKYSSMQTTMPIILLGTHDRKFRVYKHVNEIIEEWIDFRRVTIKRIKLGLIKKYKLRIHIIDGLQKILDSKVIDVVIAKIKKCSGKSSVIEMLMDDYDLTKIQAENISELKLYRLNNLSMQELTDEKLQLLSNVDKETEFFKDRTKIDTLIIEELTEFKQKYSKIVRKTKIVSNFEGLEDQIIAATEHSIIVTNSGYIKKLPPVKSQKRNGKGSQVGKLKDGDYPVFVDTVNNKDSLYIFTDLGKAYKFEINDFNEGNTSTLGNYIANSLNGEKITSCINIPHDVNPDNFSLLLSTVNNKIKLTKLTEFNNINKSGIIASKLNDGDSILNVVLIKTKDVIFPKDIAISHSNGGTSIIDTEDISHIGRTTFGCSAMHTDISKQGHKIVSVSARRDKDTHLLVISEQGYGKLVEINEFSKVKRGAKGMMNAKLRDGDKTRAVLYCNLEEDLTIITNKNIIKVPLKDVSIMKRPTMGVSIKKLDADEIVLDVTTM